MEEPEKEPNGDEFVYYDKAAARVVLRGVSEILRKKLRFEDIIKILEYKYEYLEMEGYMNGGIPTQEEPDQDGLDEFVLANAQLRKIFLNKDELLEIWMAESDYFDFHIENPIYDDEDAAEIIYENISEDLKEKIEIEDIIEILGVKFDYQQLSGLITENVSIVEISRIVDYDAMEYYIIHECAKKDIILTYKELQEIFDAEDKYLNSLGLIDEDGYQKDFN